jgi:hypothetical protein
MIDPRIARQGRNMQEGGEKALDRTERMYYSV